MPKFVLSTLILLVLSCGLSMANECQIKEINPKAESNNFTFENILEKDLKVFTANPIKTFVGSMPILIFENKKHIGFQRLEENFYSKASLEESFKKREGLCISETLKFTKNGYTFLIESVSPIGDDRETTSVFIVPDPKKTKDYFYLVSFVGFDQQDVTQMLIKNNQTKE